MILLFRIVPSFAFSETTHWMYGRYGKHDVPPGENPNFFAMRGTIAAEYADLEEVLKRELEADPK